MKKIKKKKNKKKSKPSMTTVEALFCSFYLLSFFFCVPFFSSRANGPSQGRTSETSVQSKRSIFFRSRNYVDHDCRSRLPNLGQKKKLARNTTHTAHALCRYTHAHVHEYAHTCNYTHIHLFTQKNIIHRRSSKLFIM